jgi:hypothetical protein
VTTATIATIETITTIEPLSHLTDYGLPASVIAAVFPL